MTDDPIQQLERLMSQLEGAYAKATLRAYRTDFRLFIDYCQNQDYPLWPSPIEAVSGYIEHLSGSGVRASTIRRAISALSTLHLLARMEDPTKAPEVKLAIRRMYRKLGRAARQAGAIDEKCLELLYQATDDSLRGLRNRALLLVGFDTLCRRSELTSLQVEDLRHRKILLRRSKTDPHALGRWLFLSRRSDEALHAWISAAGLTEGPIFRHTHSKSDRIDGLAPDQVNRILKRLAQKAGMDPGSISGHSMRVGAAQTLLQKGKSLADIMQRGRWSKTDTVMRYLEGTPVIFEDESHDDLE